MGQRLRRMRSAICPAQAAVSAFTPARSTRGQSRTFVGAVQQRVEHGPFLHEAIKTVVKAALDPRKAGCFKSRDDRPRIERELVESVPRFRLQWPRGIASQARLDGPQRRHGGTCEKDVPARLEHALHFTENRVVALGEVLDHSQRPVAVKEAVRELQPPHVAETDLQLGCIAANPFHGLGSVVHAVSVVAVMGEGIHLVAAAAAALQDARTRLQIAAGMAEDEAVVRDSNGALEVRRLPVRIPEVGVRRLSHVDQAVVVLVVESLHTVCLADTSGRVL